MADDDPEVYGFDYGAGHTSNEERAWPDTDVPNLHADRGDGCTGIGHPETVHELVERDGEVQPKWDWLRKLHDGHRDGGRTGPYNDDTDRSYLIDIVCERLAVKRRDRVSHLVDGIELRGRKSVTAIIAAATYAANEQNRKIRDEERYEDVRESFEVAKSEVRTARRAVREADQTETTRRKNIDMTPKKPESDDGQRELGELEKREVENLLTSFQTGITLTHDGRTVLDPRPREVYISRPRVRQQEDVRTLRFVVEVSIENLAFNPIEMSAHPPEVARQIYGDESSDDAADSEDDADDAPDPEEIDGDGHGTDTPAGDNADDGGDTDDGDGDDETEDSDKMTFTMDLSESPPDSEGVA